MDRRSGKAMCVAFASRTRMLQGGMKNICAIFVALSMAACAPNWSPGVMQMAADATPPGDALKKSVRNMIDNGLYSFNEYRYVEISNVYNDKNDFKQFCIRVYKYNISRSPPYTERESISFWMRGGDLMTHLNDDVFCQAPNLIWNRAKELDHEAGD